MSARLEDSPPTKGHTVYLDTSAVLSLAYVHAGTAVQRDQTRAARLKTFCGKLSAQGGVAVCSVLAFEEIAAIVRREALRLAEDRHRMSIRDLEQRDPAAAAAARDQARDDVVAMLASSVDGIDGVACIVKQPWCRELDAAAEGEKVRKTHRGLLKKYSVLDSMDALHVTFGIMLGCTHYVSFDRHWRDVVEIETMY